MSKSPGISNEKSLGTCSDTPKAIPNMLGDLLSGHRKIPSDFPSGHRINPKRYPERPPDKSQVFFQAASGEIPSEIAKCTNHPDLHHLKDIHAGTVSGIGT